HVDEEGADGLALAFRIGHAGEAAEEEIAGVTAHERDVVVIAEQRDHLFTLALPQQPVIDEDAMKLVADRLVDEHGGDGRGDAAAEAADHASLADEMANALDRLRLEGSHGPVAGAARDMAHEVAEQPAALRRVHDLRVEHHAVVAAPVVGADGEGRAVADPDYAKARRQSHDAGAVAHPHLLAVARLPQAIEQDAVAGHLEEGAAELAMIGALHLAAELRAQRLLAVADAEQRHAQLEHDLRRARRFTHRHRGRSARQDDAFGREFRDALRIGVERPDLAVHALLA